MEPADNILPFKGVITFVAQNLGLSDGSIGFPSDTTSQRILSTLIRILGAVDIHNPTSPIQSIRQQFSAAISDTLRLVSASCMVSVCLDLLKSNDVSLQIELYNLLAQRLSNVNALTRGNVSPDIQSITKTIKETLNEQRNAGVSIASLRALQAIAQTSVPEESSVLIDIIPTVTNTISTPGVEEACSETLDALW